MPVTLYTSGLTWFYSVSTSYYLCLFVCRPICKPAPKYYQCDSSRVKYCAPLRKSIPMADIINHREFFFRYYLSSHYVCMCMCVVYVCMCVCLCDYSHAVQTRTFKFWHWEHSLCEYLKIVFSNFWKNCFYAELLSFFYISFRFLCKFEEQLRKNQTR